MFTATVGVRRRKGLTLPTEVCERIIDHVARRSPKPNYSSAWASGTPETLKACALTCKAWTARSQWHLFHFLEVVCSSTSSQSLANFYALLDKHKTLVHKVEALRVQAGDRTMPTIHTISARLPQLLHNIKALTLSRGVLSPPPSPFFFAAMRQFRRVTKLTLWKMTFQSVHDLRHTICSLPALQVLNIFWPTWLKPHTSALPGVYPLTKIQLQIVEVSAEAKWMQDSRSIYFMKWLVKSGITASVKKAYFGNLMIINVKLLIVVASLILNCQKSLQTLSLSWGPDVDATLCKFIIIIMNVKDILCSLT